MSRPALAPSLPGRPLVGHLPAMRRDILGLLSASARECGDAAELRLGPVRALLVSHPDGIEEVLVSKRAAFWRAQPIRRNRRLVGTSMLATTGEPWRRHRRLAQPAFHRRRVEGYATAMVEEASTLVAGWRTGATIDVQAEMTRLTLAVVIRTLFGATLDPAQQRRVAATIPVILWTFQRRIESLSGNLLPEQIPTPNMVRHRRAVARLEAVLDRAMASAALDDPPTLLGLLRETTDEHGDRLTPAEIRDEAKTFFVAGHETTATALTWALHLLDRHPAAAARVRAEVAEVIGDRPARAEDLTALRWTTAVVRETLRLRPPAFVIGRETGEPVEVAGVELPARTPVLISPWVVHHDPRWWPEPEAFQPQRWLTDDAHAHPRLAYVPFAAGPHQCIGEGFALTEAVLVLATITQHVGLEGSPGHVAEPAPVVTLRVRGGLPMTVTARSTDPGTRTPSTPSGGPSSAVR